MLHTLNSGEEYMKSVSRFIFIAIVFMALASTAHALTPREQLSQMVQQLQKTPNDNALREKIIKLARTIKPAPAIPEEAERRMARGVSAMKTAKTISDYKDAAREFELATLAAPWYADAYYNLGMAQNKAEDFSKAAGSLKLYLLAAPGARDAKEARTLMYELEFKQEKVEKDKAKTAADAEKKKELAIATSRFRGTYHGWSCYVGRDHHGGCNEDQRKGSNWGVMRLDDGPIRFTFTFNEDGTIGAPGYVSWAGCGTGPAPDYGTTVFGTPTSRDVSSIVWEVRFRSEPTRRIWTEAAHDGSWIRFSCDRPIENASPGARYHYVNFERQ